MSLNDCSTFEQRRPFSNTLKGPEQLGDVPYDFITFLAVVQTLQVAFLPITWQSARQQIGRGGTSKIDEALINLKTSFAFKRVAKEHKHDATEDSIFKLLVNEITVLGHPSIRAHPNIVDLEGVCWDIGISPHDDKVWPVLVFEKSVFGDLDHFASLIIGRELGFQERLKLCLDIGAAIAHMHSNRIIHGDIKPHNVLIFKDDKGAFAAKVTDFGYSTCYSDEDEHIALPKSRPWHAPEYTNEGVKPAQARKMDVFSLGMLFLWFIFEKYFCGDKPLPEDVNWATEYFNYEGQNRLQVVIERLKQKEHLVRLAHHFLMAEDDINAEQRQALGHFFSTSLVIDSESRQADIEESLKLFNVTPILQESSFLTNHVLPENCEFKISSSIYSFYDSDYRLRIYITKCLEDRSTNDPTSPLSFQLALCYSIGFGSAKSDEKAQQMLQRSRKSRTYLDDTMDSIREESTMEMIWGTIYKHRLEIGHISSILYYEYYLESHQLAAATSIIEQEIYDLETTLGIEHSLVLQHKAHFASILRNQGRWKEAEHLDLQVMETRKRLLGQEHPSMLPRMASLALTYRNQGRWKEAEDLEVQVMETSLRVLGREHSDTLISMSNLASTFRHQGRWKEAEDLEVQVMQTSLRVLGYEHPGSLLSMGNLASTYRSQGRWKEAEELEVQVVETSSRVLGQEHPSTLTSMANSASTYRNQGRWKEAEGLEIQVMDTRKRVLGQEHPDTLVSMSNLASTYRHQGRWKEAEDLEVQVMQTSMRVLGYEHPDTLLSMDNLASTYRNQGRWKEAEELEVQVVETSSRVLGQEHPSTLTSMTNLASTYRNQGRWTEAEDREVQVMQTSMRVLGYEHPDTLLSMDNLASTYRNQGRWKEAEDLEVQVVETGLRMLGQEHPSTLTSMANLASTYQNQGRWKEAEELEVQVVETSSRVLGQEHPSTLTSMANSASTYRNQGRWKEAEGLEIQVMDTRKRVLGQEHPDTLISMSNLATTYRCQGRLNEAENLEVDVVETSLKVLGQEHPNTLTSMANLASTYRNQGRSKESEDLEMQIIKMTKGVFRQKHSDTVKKMASIASTSIAPSQLSTISGTNAGNSSNPTSISQIADGSEQDLGRVRFSRTSYNYNCKVNAIKTEDETDELESVVSNKVDIQSQADSSAAGLARYRKIAVGYFVKFFTQDAELFSLYQTATRSIKQGKFVRNHSRLLKQLFLDHNSHNTTPSQRLALDFLKSQRRRSAISSEIFRISISSNDSLKDQINSMFIGEDKNISMLGRYLAELEDNKIKADKNNGKANDHIHTKDNGEDKGKDYGKESNDGDNSSANKSDNNHDFAISSSSSGSEEDKEVDDKLSKLNETGNFITSGPHFDVFKYNLRVFLRASPQHAPAQTPAGDKLDSLADGSLEFSYETSFSIGLKTALVQMLKKNFEYFAGSELSWWPLANPEYELQVDHVRVYSVKFRSPWFYDDIPRTLAESLFPNLEAARVQRSAFVPNFLRRDAVYLHDMTLMHILYHALGKRCKINGTFVGMNSNNRYHGNPTTPAANTQSNSVNATATTAVTSQSNSANAPSMPPQVGKQPGHQHNIASNHGTGATNSANIEPVLFLSIDVSRNSSIARAIKLGQDDKTTFENLQKEYRRLCDNWFRKHITGIKFYRFRSFLFKKELDTHYIQLHTDMERYPGTQDPEYGDYHYNPQPWPANIPFPRNEVLHYFNHPGDCGTSAEAKDMLPVRIKGTILSRTIAFGIHLETRHSILTILLPSFIIVFTLLVFPGWFVVFWLDRHPNDLQNAVVPANFAISVLALVLNILISLLLFRWTIGSV